MQPKELIIAAANESESTADKHHEDRSKSLEAERVCWDTMWERLAEADGHDRRSAGYGKSGYPSIHLGELKNRVEGKDAKKVGVPILKSNGRAPRDFQFAERLTMIDELFTDRDGDGGAKIRY